MNAPRFVHLQWAVVLLLGSGWMVSPSLHAQAQSDKAVVKGKFLGDGKDGKIQHLVVKTREPFNDKAAVQLVFTEKDSASSKKPEFDAVFKRLGSALILSVFKDGGIFGCEVAHTAHEKSPFSSLGQIKTEEFKVTDTQVSGRVTTGGELDTFDQKWDVDLTFSAPLPKGAFAGDAPSANEPAPEDETKSTAKKAGRKQNAEDEPVAAAAGPKMPVAQLPLPSGANDVQYNQVVEQISFGADASVSAVAGEFSTKLKEQGWKEGSGSLMGKNNAILKRKRDGAELTIMVQPAGQGCTVKIFTEGLDWSNPPGGGAGAAKSATKSGNDADAAEAEAKRLLNDALKLIPKGL